MDTDEFYALKQGHAEGKRIFTPEQVRVIRANWVRLREDFPSDTVQLESFARSWGCGIRTMRDIIKRKSYKEIV